MGTVTIQRLPLNDVSSIVGLLEVISMRGMGIKSRWILK
jgi:hypothetical protein